MTEHDKISLAAQCLTYLCKHAPDQKGAADTAAIILNGKGLEMLKWNTAYLKLAESE